MVINPWGKAFLPCSASVAADNIAYVQHKAWLYSVPGAFTSTSDTRQSVVYSVSAPDSIAGRIGDCEYSM